MPDGITIVVVGTPLYTMLKLTELYTHTHIYTQSQLYCELRKNFLKKLLVCSDETAFFPLLSLVNIILKTQTQGQPFLKSLPLPQGDFSVWVMFPRPLFIALTRKLKLTSN